MIIELAVAAMLWPVADLHGSEQSSLKDEPAMSWEPRLAPRRAERPKERRVQVVPPTPDANINDRMDRGEQPYVTVKGFPGKRLALTWEELKKYGVIYGSEISNELAAQIVLDKLNRLEDR